MPILTTTRPLPRDIPSVMLPEVQTDEPESGWFVLGTWLILSVVALGFVTLYGNRTPRWEDWFFVPFVTGAQRVDLSWLWEDVQGHRVPILKLVFIVCYSLFGFNSKPILYLNVLLFSVLSLGLLRAIHTAAVDGAMATLSCRSYSSTLVKPRHSPGPRPSPMSFQRAWRRSCSS